MQGYLNLGWAHMSEDMFCDVAARFVWAWLRYSNPVQDPASILRKSTSGRHRPVSYPDGPMTARYRFT